MLTFYQSRIALGSKIDLALVVDTNNKEIAELFRQLWLTIFEFENRCSRFLPNSELSQFNRAAGTRQIISPEFQSVLVAAKKMSIYSNGLFNPFILPALQKAGYVHSMVSAHRNDEVDDYSELSVVSPSRLEVDDTWARIPYGTAIDIGGCGKGYIGDLLADLADTFPELAGYWFSLGGDIVTGGLNENGKPWVVQIDSANSRQTNMIGEVELPGPERYAVATSSVTRRKGTKKGKAWHHIIDPRTGKPSISETLTASVCAGTALKADVLASCAVILSAEESRAFLTAKQIQGAILQIKGGRIISWKIDPDFRFVKRNPVHKQER